MNAAVLLNVATALEAKRCGFCGATFYVVRHRGGRPRLYCSYRCGKRTEYRRLYAKSAA